MSVKDRCPSPVALGRELSTGASAGTLAHLDVCERCAELWASISLVASRASDLPEPDLSNQDVAAVRAAVLGSAAKASSRRRIARRAIRFGTAVAAAVALLALTGYLSFGLSASDAGEAAAARASVATRPEAVPRHRATVHPHTGAEQIAVGAQPDEIVRLSGGTITVEVAPLGPGERFRVITGDAEIEVRGTVFDVTAAGDLLVAVNVISGEVVVRPAGAGEVVLAAGDRWSRPSDREPKRAAHLDAREERPGTAGAGRPFEPPVPEPSSNDGEPPIGGATAAAQPGNPQQQAFEEGWRALRSGKTLDAAAAFGRAAAGVDPIAEDAAFWEAVALSRAGAQDRARGALQEFVARFPGSTRAGEAGTMLGWMLLEAGLPQEAAARFRSALGDPSPRVRSSASKGLEAAEPLR